MKKSFIILAMLLSFIIFAGCTQINTSTNKTTASNTQINTPTKPNEENKTAPSAEKSSEKTAQSNYQFEDDEYYLTHYIYGLDIAFPEFAFTDAAQIKSEDLLMFFRYIVDREKLFNYQDWFNNSDKKYHIPVSVIDPTLKKYLNINSFNASLIDGYDKNSNEIITPYFAQFGGDRQAKIVKKDHLGDGIIRLIVTFYYIDGTYQKPLYTKIYTIKLDSDNDKNYKYLSIVQEAKAN